MPRELVISNINNFHQRILFHFLVLTQLNRQTKRRKRFQTARLESTALAHDGLLQLALE